MYKTSTLLSIWHMFLVGHYFFHYSGGNFWEIPLVWPKFFWYGGSWNHRTIIVGQPLNPMDSENSRNVTWSSPSILFKSLFVSLLRVPFGSKSNSLRWQNSIKFKMILSCNSHLRTFHLPCSWDCLVWISALTLY